MTSTPRLAIVFLVAALGLVALVPASARTSAGSKYGGTLIVGLSSEADTLDPSLSRSFSSVEIYETICERLYTTDSRARLVPQLASALPAVSKDKLTYTIPLRTGVTFNDGSSSTPMPSWRRFSVI